MADPKDSGLEGLVKLAAEEARIDGLTDQELVSEWRNCEPESLSYGLLADELDRRNLDL